MADDIFPDALAFPKADQREVERLFAAFEAARSDNQQAKLSDEICNQLKIHAAA